MMTARLSSDMTDRAAATTDMTEISLQGRPDLQQYQFMWAASDR